MCLVGNDTKGYERFYKKTLSYYCDSYVVITIDKPRGRHHSSGTVPETLDKVNKLVTEFRAITSCENIRIFEQEQCSYKDFIVDKVSKRFDSEDILSCFPEQWTIIKKSTPLAMDFYKRKNEGDTRSKSRIRDVLLLLKLLRTCNQNDLEAPLRESGIEGAVAAFVALLAIFRRPRTLPVLHSIIERWALRNIAVDDNAPNEKAAEKAHEAIGHLLEVITRHNGGEDALNTPKEAKVEINSGPLMAFPVGGVGIVAQRHEGGSIWLYREAHEATYDALTELLHKQKWKNDNYKGDIISKVSAILDGIIAISWHLFASRTYYVDVFMPTQDIHAFYEYIYHRVSAIRTITLLIDIIESPDTKQLFDSLEESLLEIRSNVGYKKDKDDICELQCCLNVIGLFSSIPNAEHNDKQQYSDVFDNNLKKLRINALETLLMAFKRNLPRFCADSMPDTVLAWMNQFLKREQEDMAGETKPCPSTNKTLEEMRSLFEEMQLEARVSKLDFEGVIRPVLFNDQGCKESKGLIQKLMDKPEEINEKLKIKEVGIEYCHKHIKKALRVAYSVASFLDMRNILGNEGQFDGSLKIVDHIMNCVKERASQDRYSNDKWLRELLRDTYELRCEIQLEEWPLWETLLLRISANEQVEKVDYENLKTKLNKIESDSIQYEDILRETCDTKEIDASHRSRAFAFRSRALYLQGCFRQAHHFLDLAPTGLLSERFDHRTAEAEIHLVRAELLAISAHVHYICLIKDEEWKKNPNDEKLVKLKQEVDASVKKIVRAEQELKCAESLLRNMSHQNIWLIRLEFGWAQIRLERMLFDVELLFLAWPTLEEDEYLQKSGALEQAILEGMRRLRNVLDMLPYRSDSWDNNDENFKRIKLVQYERNTYRLWRQFFVVGAYYTSLLSNRYCPAMELREKNILCASKKVISFITGAALTGEDADHYKKRWQRWCVSMRFEKFGERVRFGKLIKPDDTIKPGYFIKEQEFLRVAIIQTMLDESADEYINEMWDARRENIPKNNDQYTKKTR